MTNSMNDLKELSDLYMTQVVKEEVADNTPEDVKTRVMQIVKAIRYKAKKEGGNIVKAFNDYMGGQSGIGAAERQMIKQRLGLSEEVGITTSEKMKKALKDAQLQKKEAEAIKKVKKEGVKLDYDPLDDPDFDHDEAEKKRGVSGKNNPKGGKKLKDIVKESGWHRRNPEKVGTPADPDYNVLKGKGKPVKASKPATTGKASKQPPGIYKPNKEGKFVKVDEAKVDTGKSADEKAKARNLRNTPPGADKDTDLKTFITRKAGESLEKARQRVRQRKHAAKRGIKEDKAFDNVVAALRKKHGESSVITKDSPKPKAQPKPKAKPQKPLSDAERNRREVIARYGGESNYKAGRGLGT